MDLANPSHSILDSIKIFLGIDLGCQDFDESLKMHINSAIFMLRKFGVSPCTSFLVSSSEDSYESYLGPQMDIMPIVNQYIRFYVKKNFDTPDTSPLISSLDSEMKKCEWFIILHTDEELYEEGGN